MSVLITNSSLDVPGIYRASMTKRVRVGAREYFGVDTLLRTHTRYLRTAVTERHANQWAVHPMYLLFLTLKMAGEDKCG